MSNKEYLVTGQGYIKTDRTKQTLLLHDTIHAIDDSAAESCFMTKFSPTHNIVRIYSVVDTATEKR